MLVNQSVCPWERVEDKLRCRSCGERVAHERPLVHFRIGDSGEAFPPLCGGCAMKALSAMMGVVGALTRSGSQDGECEPRFYCPPRDDDPGRPRGRSEDAWNIGVDFETACKRHRFVMSMGAANNRDRLQGMN